MNTSDIIREVGSIAESLEDHPLYFSSRSTAEGITAMVQAADAFGKASVNADKIDAALWVGEAYLLFSSGLPDQGVPEQQTGWATAHQIARLLGGPEIWAQRVRDEFR